jgi:hypothetical protein
MKKQIQKALKLNRETLTSLNRSDLQKPVGMAPTDQCDPQSDNTAWTCAWVRGNCVGW